MNTCMSPASCMFLVGPLPIFIWGQLLYFFNKRLFYSILLFKSNVPGRGKVGLLTEVLGLLSGGIYCVKDNEK